MLLYSRYFTGSVTGAAIHGGPGGFASAAPVVATIPVGNYTGATVVLTPSACQLLTSGNAYINVMTTAYPLGMSLLAGGDAGVCGKGLRWLRRGVPCSIYYGRGPCHCKIV